PVAEGKRFDTLNFDGKAAVNVKGNLALTLRHELGHCNGWPNDHPDGRTTSYDQSVTMPKLPTTTQVVCTNSDRIYIDCKIAKPWWPQESAVTTPRPPPAQASNAQTPEESRNAMEERSGVKQQFWDCGEGMYIPVVRDIRTPSWSKSNINGLVWGEDTFSFWNNQLYRKYGLHYIPCARDRRQERFSGQPCYSDACRARAVKQ